MRNKGPKKEIVTKEINLKTPSVKPIAPALPKLLLFYPLMMISIFKFFIKYLSLATKTVNIDKNLVTQSKNKQRKPKLTKTTSKPIWK